MNAPHDIIDWIAADAIPPVDEVHAPGTVIGWMGGWVNAGLLGAAHDKTQLGHRWQDFLDFVHDPSLVPYLDAVRREILATNNRRGGFWHQDAGCPRFRDGRVLSLSFRAWGDLQAAIWSTQDNRDYCYADFAWSDPAPEAP